MPLTATNKNIFKWLDAAATMSSADDLCVKETGLSPHISSFN